MELHKDLVKLELHQALVLNHRLKVEASSVEAVLVLALVLSLDNLDNNNQQQQEDLVSNPLPVVVCLEAKLNLSNQLGEVFLEAKLNHSNQLEEDCLEAKLNHSNQQVEDCLVDSLLNQQVDYLLLPRNQQEEVACLVHLHNLLQVV